MDSFIPPLSPPLPPLRPAGSCTGPDKPGGQADQARQVGQGFESILLYKVMEEMGKTIPNSGLLDNQADEQVQSIFRFYMSSALAQQGGLGLGSELQRQAEHMHVRADPTAPTPRQR